MHVKSLTSKIALLATLSACSFAGYAQTSRKPDYAGHYDTVREIAAAAETLKPYFSDISLACRKVRPFEKVLIEGNQDATLMQAWVDFAACCPINDQVNAIRLSIAGLQKLPVTGNQIAQKVYDQAMTPYFTSIQTSLKDAVQNTQAQCTKVVAFSLMIPKDLTVSQP